MDKEKQTQESRRDFLKKAGKFAVYTPPALMIMTKSGHAEMKKSVHMDNGCGNGDDPAPTISSLNNNNAENALGGLNCPNGINNPN